MDGARQARMEWAERKVRILIQSHPSKKRRLFVFVFNVFFQRKSNRRQMCQRITLLSFCSFHMSTVCMKCPLMTSCRLKSSMPYPKLSKSFRAECSFEFMYPEYERRFAGAKAARVHADALSSMPLQSLPGAQRSHSRFQSHTLCS